MTFDAERETLVSLFCGRSRLSGPQLALYVPRGARPAALASAIHNSKPATYSSPVAARFDLITWDELARDVRRTAVALRNLGVAPGDRVAQVSGNRYMWIVVDLAVHLARGVHVALHNALSVEQMAWQIADSESRLVLGTADATLFGTTSAAQTARNQFSARIVNDDELARLAGDVLDDAACTIEDEAAVRVSRGDLATILYTSGTTGEPKGVMLSHGNLASNALAALSAFQVREDDLRLCWLPLSHIYARTSDLYTWIAQGHAMGLAQSRETLMVDLAVLHPTIINGVPYFYDKLRRHLMAQGRAVEPGALQQLLGGRMRLCCAGGAPLPDYVAEFFAQQGVLLVQGYGLTESSPVISTGSADANRIGTVGKPIPGVEVRIADDGEILTRGPHVMLGYWKRPLDTAAAIRDGWLHTGDLGALEDGYLRITGRKKELMVMNSGKKVVPAHLESLLTSDPLIAQALVIGEGRNYLAALIVPDREQLRSELGSHNIQIDSRAENSTGDELSQPAVIALINGRIAACLSGVSDWEQVRKFILVGRPFSTELDELTPTLKLRRGVILSHFFKEIESLYAVDAADPNCPLESASLATRPKMPGEV